MADRDTSEYSDAGLRDEIIQMRDEISKNRQESIVTLPSNPPQEVLSVNITPDHVVRPKPDIILSDEEIAHQKQIAEFQRRKEEREKGELSVDPNINATPYQKSKPFRKVLEFLRGTDNQALKVEPVEPKKDNLRHPFQATTGQIERRKEAEERLRQLREQEQRNYEIEEAGRLQKQQNLEAARRADNEKRRANDPVAQFMDQVSQIPPEKWQEPVQEGYDAAIKRQLEEETEGLRKRVAERMVLGKTHLYVGDELVTADIIRTPTLIYLRWPNPDPEAVVPESNHYLHPGELISKDLYLRLQNSLSKDPIGKKIFEDLNLTTPEE